MTIFPCRRCGGVPEVLPGGPDLHGRPSAILRHACGRHRRNIQMWRPDFDRAKNDVIYEWNEWAAANNPAWWEERYDYLHDVWKTQRKEAPK